MHKVSSPSLQLVNIKDDFVIIILSSCYYYEKPSFNCKTFSERFPVDYVPTIFDNFVVNQLVDGLGAISLNLWDTAGNRS